MKSKEWVIRNLAIHLALLVRRRGQKLVLRERRGLKRYVGARGEYRSEPDFFRSWAQVERAIDRWSDKELARLK